jgi:hypothetical protein
MAQYDIATARAAPAVEIRKQAFPPADPAIYVRLPEKLRWRNRPD